jgi:hypothetical protein
LYRNHRILVTRLLSLPESDVDQAMGIQARYKATREEIAARYAKWEITGPGWTPSDVGHMFAYRWNRRGMVEGERVNDLLKRIQDRRLTWPIAEASR